MIRQVNTPFSSDFRRAMLVYYSISIYFTNWFTIPHLVFYQRLQVWARVNIMGKHALGLNIDFNYNWSDNNRHTNFHWKHNMCELFVWAFQSSCDLFPTWLKIHVCSSLYEEISRLIQPRISGVKQNSGYSRLEQLPSRVILGLMPPRISGMINQPNREIVDLPVWFY